MEVYKRKEFWYKLILFSLVFLFPFAGKLGVVDILNFRLFFFRILLAIAFFLLLVNRDMSIPWKHNLKFLFLFSAYLLVYGLISLLWVDDIYAALQQISYILWGGCTIMVFFSLLIKVQFSMNVVFKAWAGVFFTLVLFALIEVFGVVHFGGSFVKNLQQFDTFRKAFHSPMATFTNPNDYAVFILYSMVFFLLFSTKKNIILTFIAITVSVFLLSFIKSNLAFFAFYFLGAAVVIYTIIRLILNRSLSLKLFKLPVFHYSGRGAIIPRLFFAAIVVLCVAYSIYSNPVFINNDGDQENFVPLKKSTEGLKNVAEKITKVSWIKTNDKTNPFNSESYNIRRGLAANGWCMAKQSFFMGKGAGQFVHILNSEDICFEISMKTNPHNFIIEILAQYGLIPVILFLIFIVSVLFIAVRSSLKDIKRGIDPQCWFILLMIPVYLLLSNAPSSFFSHSMNWITLSILAFLSRETAQNTRSITQMK